MDKSILSLKLKEYRKQKGHTQEELAELLDVSDKSISKWELGNGYPSKKNMMKISELLDVSLEVLMIEEQAEDTRLKRSFKYALVSYFIIISLTILIRGIKEADRYKDILSSDVSEIMKIVIVNFGQNIYIAIVPALIIGLVSHFYLIPRQEAD
ncbi:helix-turn-helix transcriptional regulator [Sporosarcina ureae]|uniref:helix-turn-helix transcriptional regulator n=1 Tax=Sporosarcina ureae TaxID=1571 RepID=UPI0028AAE0B4|nr:helix-turn-helix transcriptional regulator [Sporosarcina ureae]